MSIQQKFLIPVLGIMGLSVIVAVILSVFSFSNFNLKLEEDQFQQEAGIVLSQVGAKGNALLYQSSQIAGHKDVLRLYKQAHAGDLNDPRDPQVQAAREGLREALAPILSSIERVTGDKRYRLHLHLPNSRSLLRSWRNKQTLAGEDLSDDLSSFRPMIAELSRRGKGAITGVEVGRGGFALRGISSILDEEGAYLGSVESYINFSTIIEAMRTRQEDHFAVFMNMGLLEIARSLKDPDLFPVVGDQFVLVNATDKRLAQDLIPVDMLQEGRRHASDTRSVHGYHLKTFPLFDFSGNQVGVIALMHDMASQQAAVRGMLLYFAVVSLFMLLVIGGAVYMVARGISQPLRRLTEAFDHLALGQLETCEDTTRKDEIGRLMFSFRHLTDQLREKVELAGEIALGRTNTDFKPASSQDELGHSMLRMQQNLAKRAEDAHRIAQGDLETIPKSSGEGDVLGRALQEMVFDLREARTRTEQAGKRNEDLLAENHLVLREVQQFAASLEQGDLKSRLMTEGREGDSRELMESLNRALDQVMMPVGELIELMTALQSGDIRGRMQSVVKGDLQTLKKTVNGTLDSWAQNLRATEHAAQQVREGADQTVQASLGLSEGASRQTGNLHSIAVNLVEIDTSAGSNAALSAKASSETDQTFDSVRQSEHKVQELNDVMDSIRDASKRIQQIISKVDEIAFQTRLLSLNASVEAARAGVHGKGFAVVAEEVGTLAQRSAQAASETEELISTAVDRVEMGGRLATEASSSLADVVTRMKQVQDYVHEISESSRVQAGSVSGVTSELGAAELVTKSNSVNATKIASTMESLGTRAGELYSQIRRFQV